MSITISAYHESKTYDGIIYENSGLHFSEFESCTFSNCNFCEATFLAVVFIDCTFINCNFESAKINYVSLRTVHFIACNLSSINFAMVDQFIFEVHFSDCLLDFSKFYSLKLKNTVFANCSMIAMDFMNADMTKVNFDGCDLYQAVFDKTNLNQADFRTSRNYSFNPAKNKVKKAIFSKDGLAGLLKSHDIVVV